MERTYGRHMRSRISQPTLYSALPKWWVLDRAFGPDEVFQASGNRHNRLAAIRRGQLSAADQALQDKNIKVGRMIAELMTEPLPDLSGRQS